MPVMTHVWGKNNGKDKNVGNQISDNVDRGNISPIFYNRKLGYSTMVKFDGN